MAKRMRRGELEDLRDRWEQTPASWLVMALQHRQCAEAMWNLIREIDGPRMTASNMHKGLFAYSDGYLFYYGLAFECLIKGLLIETGAMSGSGARKQGHNVAVVANQHLKITAGRDRAVLTYLEQCVVWRGKYPVPLPGRGTDLRDQLLEGKNRKKATTIPMTYPSRICRLFLTLYNRYSPDTRALTWPYTHPTP